MFGLAAAAVLAIAAIALSVFQWYEQRVQLRGELDARVAIVERLARRTDDLERWHLFDAKLAEFTPDDGSLHFLVESTDTRFRIGGAVLDALEVRPTLDGYGDGALDDRPFAIASRDLPANRERPAVRLLIAAARDDADHALAILVTGIVLVSLFAVLAVAWLGMRIARIGLAPVDRLSDHARQLDASDLARRLPVDALPTELVGMVDALNAALARLENAYARQAAFNADVAHELRTPLGNLIGETEVALSRERGADMLEDVLRSNLEELERLRGIVNAMLFLARADRGETARDRVAVSLQEESRRAADFLEVVLEEAGTTLDIRGDARVAVEGSLYALALTNLIDNAMRHGDAGGTIIVDIVDLPHAATVTVDSPGAPIPAAALPHIFDRFYRADPARNVVGNGRSHGLGLAIVQAIAQLHGGSVFASCGEGRVRIGIQLPKDAVA